LQLHFFFFPFPESTFKRSKLSFPPHPQSLDDAAAPELLLLLLLLLEEELEEEALLDEEPELDFFIVLA